MRPIQMVDLKKQYQEIKADVDAALLLLLKGNKSSLKPLTEATRA